MLSGKEQLDDCVGSVRSVDMLNTDPVGGFERMSVSGVAVESLPDFVISKRDLEDVVAEMTQNNRLNLTITDLVQQIMSRRTFPSNANRPEASDASVPMEGKSPPHTPIFSNSKFCSPDKEAKKQSSPEFNFKTPRKVFPDKPEEPKEAPAATESATNAFEFEALKEQVHTFTSTTQKNPFPTFGTPSKVAFNVSLPTKSKTKNKARYGVSTFGGKAANPPPTATSDMPPPPPAPTTPNDVPMEEDAPAVPPAPPSDFVFQFSSFHIGADKPKASKHPAEDTFGEDSRPHKHNSTDASHMKENIIDANSSSSSGTADAKPPSVAQPFGTFQYPQTSNEVPTFEFSTTSFTVGATNTTPTKKKTPKKHSPRKPHKPSTPLDTSEPASTAAATPISKMEEEEQEDIRRMEVLANLMKNQGKDNYNVQNYTAALDAYTKALNAAPPLWEDRSMVLGNRAATFMMLERYVEAVEDCDAALKTDYTSVRMHNRRGRALLKLGLLEEATSSFMFCISLLDSIRDAETQGMKETISSSLKQIALIRTLLLRIENLFTDKNYKRIVVTCDEILHVAPYSRQALIHKCRAMSHLHQWNECRALLELHMAKLHPSVARLYAHPMTSFPLPTDFKWKETGAGNVDVDQYAVTQLIFALGDQLGRIYLGMLKNMSICRQCTVSVMQILINILTPVIPPNKISPPRYGIPESDWSWTEEERLKIRTVLEAKHLADKQFRSGNYTEAMSQYGEVLQLDPDAHIWNAIMYGNRAAAAMRLGKFTEAVSDCHQSIARDPEYARAYLRRARAQKALGQHAAAIRDFQKYISSVPRPSDANEVHAEMQEAIMQKNIAEHDTNRSKGRFERERGKTYHRNAFEDNRYRRDDDSSDGTEYSNFKREEFYDFIRGLNGRGGARPGGAAAGARSAHQERKSHNRTHYSRSNTHQKQQRSAPPEDTTPDHYKQLGISKTATEQEIKTAYRKLALKYHPDKNKDEAAVDIFKSITEAYSVLSDKVTRRRYDEIRMFSTRF